MSGESRPAATVLVLRQTTEGPRVFMVQRHRKSGFMPNAWVFPGGRVDPLDSLSSSSILGGQIAAEQMKLPFESALPFMIAAIRETFEESGIWLGTGSIPDSLREPLARSDVSLVDLVNQYSATLNLDALRAWSWWVTPAIEPRRYDTRFFVARTTSAVGQHDDQETVDSRWVDPRDAIARATAETFPLAPPTWWTLKELAAFDTVDEAFDAALHKEQRPIQPILAPDVEGAWMLKLPGHPDHPEPPMANLPTAVRFSQGRWWASQ